MGEADDSRNGRRIVLLNTTLLDALVRAVDSPEFKEELYARGYNHLLIQIGRGSYIPSMEPWQYVLHLQHLHETRAMAESISIKVVCHGYLFDHLGHRFSSRFHGLNLTFCHLQERGIVDKIEQLTSYWSFSTS